MSAASATSTSRVLRSVVVLGLAAVTFVASFATGLDPASAGTRPRERQPALTLTGSGTWQIREFVGDAVVNGTAEVQLRGERRVRTTQLAATVDPDDNTFPAPGECEGGISTVTSYGKRTQELHLMGIGELCALHLQPPTSVVKYTFTGTYEVLEGPCRLRYTQGFFEIRLAEDGSAHVFAIDT